MKVQGVCVCLVVLFIVLAPGFILNVPAKPEETQIIPMVASFGNFQNPVQTIVHAVVFAVAAGLLCKSC